MNNLLKKDVCGTCYLTAMAIFILMLITSVIPDFAYAKFFYTPAFSITPLLMLVFVCCLFFYFNLPIKNLEFGSNQVFVTCLFAILTLTCAINFLTDFIRLCNGADAIDYIFSMLSYLVFAVCFGFLAVQTMRNFPAAQTSNLFSLLLFAGLLFLLIDSIMVLSKSFTAAKLFGELFELAIYGGFFAGIFFELKTKFNNDNE